MTDRPDGRVRPKMNPPHGRVGAQITAHLSAQDYRAYYDVVMARGTSGSETIRQLIREEKDRLTLSGASEGDAPAGSTPPAKSGRLA